VTRRFRPFEATTHGFGPGRTSARERDRPDGSRARSSCLTVGGFDRVRRTAPVGVVARTNGAIEIGIEAEAETETETGAAIALR
jgi:hypothetical protein